MKVCIEPGCPVLTRGTRCQRHERERDQRRGGTTERGYGSRWQSLRLRILRRDGYRCRVCGGRADAVDHVMPKVRGGSDDESNLRAICTPCNSARVNRRP